MNEAMEDSTTARLRDIRGPSGFVRIENDEFSLKLLKI